MPRNAWYGTLTLDTPAPRLGDRGLEIEMTTINTLTGPELNCDQLKHMAIGRLFRLASRPFQDGDIEEYERCRAIIMHEVDPCAPWQANYAADRLKGSGVS